MQQIAFENNLSETAFVVRKGNAFELRWFTPTVEVDLCGHATVAPAHVRSRGALGPLGSAHVTLYALPAGTWRGKACWFGIVV